MLVNGDGVTSGIPVFGNCTTVTNLPLAVNIERMLRSTTPTSTYSNRRPVKTKSTGKKPNNLSEHCQRTTQVPKSDF